VQEEKCMGAGKNCPICFGVAGLSILMYPIKNSLDKLLAFSFLHTHKILAALP